MSRFTGCAGCLDTGWKHQPHSDESREVCDCPAGKRVAGYLAGGRNTDPELSPYAWVSPATSEPYVWTNPLVRAVASPSPWGRFIQQGQEHSLGTASLAGDELELQRISSVTFRVQDSADVDDRKRYPFHKLNPKTGLYDRKWWFKTLPMSWRVALLANAHRRASSPVSDITWTPVLIVAAIVFGPWIIGAWLT